MLTGILQPSHDEDSLQQEAYAQPNQSKLHGVDELAAKELQKHILHLLLADFIRMVSQTAAGDDPEVECALAIVDDQSSQDGPVVPAEQGSFQMSSPKTRADCGGDEDDEEDIDTYKGSAGARGP